MAAAGYDKCRLVTSGAVSISLSSETPDPESSKRFPPAHAPKDDRKINNPVAVQSEY